MMAFILQIVVGLIVLGILVLVHEFGHFIVAKMCGIRVLAFSIGFGKPLLKKTVGPTEYRICAIPFGGYVHMAGENPEDKSEKAPDEYPSKPIWQRALVAIAGPGANYAFSILALWFVFVWGTSHELYLDNTVVGAVSDSSAAIRAGLEPGDSLVSVNGEHVQTWEQIDKFFSRQEPEYRIEYVRGSKKRQAVLNPATNKKFGFPRSSAGGMLPPLPAVVGSVQPGSPAENAGLKTGDSVISIDKREIHSWYQLSQIVADYDSTDVVMDVALQRKDSVFSVKITPEYDSKMDRYLMGISAAKPETRIIRYNIVAAFPKAMHKTWRYTTMIFDVIGKLATKQVSTKQLAGPIGIVQMSGVAAMGGLSAILNFMAIIGINLGLLNLLPLIITDGGVLLFLGLEAIRGKPLALKYQILINRIAIACFIALFLYVTFNDIRRFPLLFRLFSR